jgi:hypothetical protein
MGLAQKRIQALGAILLVGLLLTSCADICSNEEPVAAPPGPPAPAGPPPKPEAAELPELPHELPAGAVTYEIRPGIAFGPGATTFYDRYMALSHRLAQSDFSDPRLYAVGPGGFALVCQLERINAAGQPLSPRWFSGGFDEEGLDSLIIKDAESKGGDIAYRVLILVVSPHPPLLSSEARTPEEMQRLFERGSPDSDFPNPMAEDSTQKCVAYVYQYSVAPTRTGPSIRVSGQLRAQDHLVAAGLWKRKDL